MVTVLPVKATVLIPVPMLPTVVVPVPAFTVTDSESVPCTVPRVTSPLLLVIPMLEPLANFKVPALKEIASPDAVKAEELPASRLNLVPAV